jgi:hypothetical protein
MSARNGILGLIVVIAAVVGVLWFIEERNEGPLEEAAEDVADAIDDAADEIDDRLDGDAPAERAIEELARDADDALEDQNPGR